MGKLVEQTIPSLFGGVSRQPSSVRRPEQVEAGDNALFSVATGGFEKRPNTQYINKCTYLDNAADYAFNPIDRSSTEQYIVLIDPDATTPTIIVMDAINGTQKTVTIGDTKRYFAIENSSMGTGTGILEDSAGVDIETHVAFASSETTFDWGWKLSDGVTGRFKIEGSADGISWNDIATGKGGATSGTFSTTIDAVATGDHNYLRVTVTTGMASASDTVTVWATFADKTYVLDALSTDIKMATIADTTFIANRNVITRMAEADGGTIAGSVQVFSDLPAATGSGNVQYVIGNAADGFGSYYAKDNSVNGSNVWQETVDPTAHNNFDASSMPHKLVRNSDDTFTFSACTWGPRAVGDEEITPEPDFIGLAIQDVTLYRNRLTLIADEQVYSSRAGEVFEMFPEKAVEVLDNDPVARAASETDINVLKNVAVFKKVLFTTSVRAQFEMTSTGALTPASAVLDLATSYPASDITRPIVMGDLLFFPGVGADHATIYEYYFDEASLSNTAQDVTKHCFDYIKNDVLMMAADATSQTLFVLTTNDQNRVYVYRTWFDGTEKLQSSWGRYQFGATEADAFVIGMAVMSGFLVLLIERQDGGIYLEQMPIEREDHDATMGYIPLLDLRDTVTPTYTAATDVSAFELSWEHDDDAQIAIGPGFAAAAGAVPATYHPSRYTLTLASVAAAETIVINSTTFTAHATTTTVASREFSISGNDIADAGELVTCINDATYGVSGVTATDNGDGTITLNLDNQLQNDGITSPTGTAVTNTTITVAQNKNVIACKSDYSAAASYVGRNYTMSVVLSKLFVKDGDPEVANLTGALAMKDITFNLVDTGYCEVEVALTGRTAKEYSFEGKILGDTAKVGPAVLSDAFFRVPLWGDAKDLTITVSNDEPLPCVVTSAAWRAMFNEVSRQE